MSKEQSIQLRSVLAEVITVEAEYGLEETLAIVDHHKHGRIMIKQSFGGVDSLQGGAVRWSHGVAVKLRSNDTFADLDADWNSYCSILDAVLNGHDDTRPVFEWDGCMVEQVARSVGLMDDHALVDADLN